MSTRIILLSFFTLALLGAGCRSRSDYEKSLNSSPVTELPSNDLSPSQSIWNRYYNQKYKFSLMIPRYAMIITSPSQIDDKDKKNSAMPIAIFDNGDGVLITSALTRRYVDSTANNISYEAIFSVDGNTLVPSSSVVTTTLAIAQNASIIRIDASNSIRDYEAINNFVAQKIGNGCKVSERNLSEIENLKGSFTLMTDLTRNSSTVSDSSLNCKAMQSHAIKGYYNSASGTAVIVSLAGGRAITFTDFQGKVLDEAIFDSFKFE